LWIRRRGSKEKKERLWIRRAGAGFGRKVTDKKEQE